MKTKTVRRDFLVGSAALGLAANLPLSASTAANPDRRALAWNVLDYCAVGDGKRMNTKSILAAIGACAAAGGGTVFVPAGKYLTGAIRLESNVNLHLGAGATLLGSEDPADYPVYSSPWPDGTRQISSLIYGENLVNVSVTGRGAIDGQGHAWWVRLWLAHAKRRVPVPTLTEDARREEISKIQFGRPRLVRLVGCRNVLLEGLTLANSPAWTVHPIFCESVNIRGITILNPVPSPNTDGIDPESCRNVHISDCHIDVGDDCIAIKAGKDALGRKVGKPCENITITNLTARRGHGGVSIGSEMSGGVRNVAISNCVFHGTDRGIRIKTERGRGGAVQGITASNIVMQDVPEAFNFTMFYEGRRGLEEIQPVSEATPRFRDFYMENISARGSKSAGEITGLREMPISSVTLSNVHVESAAGFFCQNAERIEFHDVRIEPARGPALTAKNVQGLELDGFGSAHPHPETPVVDLENVKDVFARGCVAAPETASFLKVSGVESGRIVLRANNLGAAARAVEFGKGASPAILSEK